MVRRAPFARGFSVRMRYASRKRARLQHGKNAHAKTHNGYWERWADGRRLIAIIRWCAGAQNRAARRSWNAWERYRIWRWRNAHEQQSQLLAVWRCDSCTRWSRRLPVTNKTPAQIPALQITHTVDDLWRVAAKWSDGQVENIADFESEVDANDWIANEFQDWLEKRRKASQPIGRRRRWMRHCYPCLGTCAARLQPVAYAPAVPRAFATGGITRNATTRTMAATVKARSAQRDAQRPLCSRRHARRTMKAIALTAAGLLASTPVGAQTLKLPNEMLGTWCPTQDPLVEEKDGTITVKYERRQDCNPADDTSIVLGPRG